jgi:site-specific DNA recombinase
LGPVIDVYARLSYSVNGETIQVDDQVEMGEETLARRGAVVGAVFKDPSKSAWHPRVVRPQWDALMARLESGASDGVWVYDLTRFSRKVLEGERLVELAARGLRVWSQSGEYDLTTADGRAHFREAMVAAARESDKISERTRRGNYRRARRGRNHGGPRAFGLPGWAPVPPGWEPGDPRERVPDEQVAAERTIIRECYDRLFAGESLAALVGDLNARGVLTNFGKPWGRSPLRKVLSRASVAGLLEFRGEVVGQLAGVEPIVTREEWERLLAILDGRRRGRPPGLGAYVLSGLVRCGRCGSLMYGTVRPNKKPYPDGSVCREYRCRTSSDWPQGCARNLIDFRIAEEAVGEAVKARLGDPRRADRIARHLASVRAERDEIHAEIASLEESADGLAEKTAEWGLDRVNKAMRPIMARLDELNAKLAALEAPESPSAAVEDAARAWDEARERGDVQALRAMVKRAFPRLTLRPGERWGDHSPSRFDWDGQSLTEIGRT